MILDPDLIALNLSNVVDVDDVGTVDALELVGR